MNKLDRLLEWLSRAFQALATIYTFISLFVGGGWLTFTILTLLIGEENFYFIGDPFWGQTNFYVGLRAVASIAMASGSVLWGAYMLYETPTVNVYAVPIS